MFPASRRNRGGVAPTTGRESRDAVLSASQVSTVEDAAWFQTKWAPTLLVDRDLRIRAVNTAFELVTRQRRDSLVGRMLFDVFPDNPANPGADGVANVSASMELVLRRGERHWMGVQRYDIPDRTNPGEFVYRVWTPVNSPINDCGKTVAVLQQVQDVTRVVPRPAGRCELAELEKTAGMLGRCFPDLPAEAVLGVLTHSHNVVVETAGAADLERSVALARLRLEARAGYPADEA